MSYIIIRKETVRSRDNTHTVVRASLPEVSSQWYVRNRYLSRFFDCLAHPNLSAAFAIDQKLTLSCRRISYQSLAECHLP